MIQLTHPSIGKPEMDAAIAVLKSGQLGRGQVTKDLEYTFGKTLHSKHTLMTANGTAAIVAALVGCGIKPGDEVITTPLSFIATVNAILLCGAKPVFADIDSAYYTIDPQEVQKKVTKRTKAVLTVDLYGQPADYDPLKQLCTKHGLYLISDACQAIGSLYHKKPINAFADATIYSFFNSKAITAGEGGLLATPHGGIAEKANQFINHGQKRGEKFAIVSLGWNFRPTDIQSAIIGKQLVRLPGIIRKRRENASYLMANLSGCKGLILPAEQPNTSHSYSRFTIQLTSAFPLSRDACIHYLSKKMIETEVAYPKPLYSYPHVIGFKQGDFPVVERIVKYIVSLPIHQNLSKKDLDYMVRCITSISHA